tara:strand:+ start:803 stop:1756 length:954 start_codon:yes stop_codon:yes gene_type:complete
MIRIIILLLISNCCFSQSFEPLPGENGSIAIHKDSSLFIDWAENVVINRGPMYIENISLGNADFGLESDGIGIADGIVVSLGDGGTAVTTFTNLVLNGPGYDFAIFENGYTDDYLELAFVEVSSDGLNYFRFDAVSETSTDIQKGNADFIDCRFVNNLAGKYRVNYGTPFDLEELSGIPELDINAISHIKLIDVVGSINPLYASFDSEGTIVNDPYPTPFSSSGFDLDAIGIIHSTLALNENSFIKSVVYPNPSTGLFQIDSEFIGLFLVTNIQGKIIAEGALLNNLELDISQFDNGLYYLNIISKGNKKQIKLYKN